jgi:PAS domain S-box-containing protein
LAGLQHIANGVVNRVANAFRLSQKLTAATIIAGLILVVGALSVVTVQALIRATTRVDETDNILQQLEFVLLSAQNAETGQRGYLLTADSAYLSPYHRSHERADSAIAVLRRASPLTASWAPELDSLVGDVAAKFAELDTTIALFDGPSRSDALALARSNRGKALMDLLRGRVLLLEGMARNVRSTDADARASVARTAIIVIVLASLIAFVLSVMVNRAIRADMMARVKSSEDLKRSADALAAQTSRLDQELEESQSLAEELAQTGDELQGALVEAEEGRSSAQAAERRTTTILTSLPDAISVFDHDGRLRYFNATAASLLSALGHTPDRMVGRILWDDLPDLATTKFLTETRRALETGSIVEFEEYLESLDRWMSTRIIPAAETVVAVTQDITEKKRAAEEAAFVADLNTVLAEAPLELADVLKAIAQFAVPRLSDYCSIDVLDADGMIRRIASVHRDPDKESLLRDMWARYPYDAAAEYGSPAVMRTGAPQFQRKVDIRQVTAFARSPEHERMLAELNPRSYVAVAIPGPTGPLGVIALVMSDSDREMTQRSVELATIVATRAGIAVERAMLHGELRVARDAAAASADRAEFLALASQLLASSLDYEVTLQHVAQLCVPRLADWCSVEIVEPDGTTRQLAVAHKDPAKVAWARDLNRRYPPNPRAVTGVPQVIRSGQSEFYPEIPEEMLRAGAVDDEHFRIIQEIGFTSALVVPMTARDRVHGAITLVSAESGKRYTRTDLTLAEELARRAAMAVDNARLFREAERSRAEAISANRAKSDFLATISHEIRTPINAVLGYTQLIEMGLSGPLTAEQRVQIDRIASSTNHLLSLVNEVLDLAKVESGTLAVQLKRASVGLTVDDALALLRPQAADRGVTLSEKCEGERSVTYIGDAHRVRQVLTNLVANAVKFTNPGGMVTVSCSANETPPPQVSPEAGVQYVAIRVTDTGVGIPAEALDRIFEPFTQVDSGYTREKSGTGLGLTISRQLAHLMGGEITVESSVSHGSTFTLWLPRSEDVRVSVMETPARGSRAVGSENGTRRVEFQRLADTLIRRIPDILSAWRQRLRSPSGIPEASSLTNEQLDDHAATLLTDITLTLRVLGGMPDRGADFGGLVRDSKVITRAIAEQHGAQRQRLGWNESSIEREMHELAEAVIAAIGSGRTSASPEAREAANVTRELIAQSIRISQAAFRAAVVEERT